MLSQAARRLMEALRDTKNREYKSDFARRYFSEGEAQGEARGEVKGEAKAVLAVLSARGIEVPEQERVRISECADLVQLDEWVRRAATARTIGDLFTP